ncbi:MAG: DUF4469 domain-containing protein [Prevotellaceae bacterium]|jgi:hypothetical protein|nr:DUF4469 domain-containing protein [Prevotellaceae bacterium]
MLNYSLHENLLTDRTDDYSAQAHASTVYTREGVIELMLQRGTLVTKTDIVAVLNNLEETVRFIVENGGQVNTSLFNTGFSISGIFEGVADTFDPLRHRLHVTIHKGTILREVEKKVRLSKISAPSPKPQIIEVRDIVSGRVDDLLTSGGVAELAGVNIRISGSDVACGLYFVAADGTETRAVTLVMNKPSRVVVLIPALAAGEYRVKITTQYSGGKEWKAPKTMVFDKALRVL